VCLYDRVPYSDKWHTQKCSFRNKARGIM